MDIFTTNPQVTQREALLTGRHDWYRVPRGSKLAIRGSLGGGFKYYVIFSPLFVEDSQFD